MSLPSYLIPTALMTVLLGGSCVVEEGCYSDEWQCDDGLCILGPGHCDGVDDCDDGSDEAHCSGCLSDEWQCADRDCIPDSGRCDGPVDCLDGSDERWCGCGIDEFECADGACILQAEVCDGTDDCADGADEDSGLCVGCNNVYICDDLSQIEATLVCDGTAADCPDDSDEDYCWVPNCASGGGFECDNGVCWQGGVVCNGINECGDCSDENGC